MGDLGLFVSAQLWCTPFKRAHICHAELSPIHNFTTAVFGGCDRNNVCYWGTHQTCFYQYGYPKYVLIMMTDVLYENSAETIVHIHVHVSHQWWPDINHCSHLPLFIKPIDVGPDYQTFIPCTDIGLVPSMYLHTSRQCLRLWAPRLVH